VNSNTFQSDRDGDTHKTGQEPSTDTAVTVVQCVNTRCRRQWLVRVVMMEGPTTDEAKNRQTSRRRKRRNELTIPG
jgi:hypothetical protein